MEQYDGSRDLMENMDVFKSMLSYKGAKASTMSVFPLILKKTTLRWFQELIFELINTR